MPGASAGMAATLATAAALILSSVVAGHGVLLQPRSRNMIAYLEQHYDWADELNSGGAKMVSQNGSRTWPYGKYGRCGDRHRTNKWGNAGPVQATYVEGGSHLHSSDPDAALGLPGHLACGTPPQEQPHDVIHRSNHHGGLPADKRASGPRAPVPVPGDCIEQGLMLHAVQVGAVRRSGMQDIGPAWTSPWEPACL